MKKFCFAFSMIFLLISTASLSKTAETPTEAQMAKLNQLFESRYIDQARFWLFLMQSELIATDIYEMDVICEHEAALKAAHLSSINGALSQETFPTPADCEDGPAEGIIFRFPRDLTTKEVTAEMGKAGFHPGTWPELLALAAAHPYLQIKEQRITAIGSQGHYNGEVVVPNLIGYDGRLLAMSKVGHVWPSGLGILGVVRDK